MDAKLGFNMPSHVGSNDWVKVASKIGKREAERLGIDFREAEITVTLPERGRVLIKYPGETAFTSYG